MIFKLRLLWLRYQLWQLKYLEVGVIFKLRLLWLRYQLWQLNRLERRLRRMEVRL